MATKPFGAIRGMQQGKRLPGTWSITMYNLIGGIALHQGKVAEMQTGEGKTLVVTLPVYLNALAGNGVHLVTVNDYLAKRDSAWMGPILNSTAECRLYRLAPPNWLHEGKPTMPILPTGPTTNLVSTT